MPSLWSRTAVALIAAPRRRPSRRTSRRRRGAAECAGTVRVGAQKAVEHRGSRAYSVSRVSRRIGPLRCAPGHRPKHSYVERRPSTPVCSRGSFQTPTARPSPRRLRWHIASPGPECQIIAEGKSSSLSPPSSHRQRQLHRRRSELSSSLPSPSSSHHDQCMIGWTLCRVRHHLERR